MNVIRLRDVALALPDSAAGGYLPMILSASLQPDSIAPWTVPKCLWENRPLLIFLEEALKHFHSNLSLVASPAKRSAPSYSGSAISSGERPATSVAMLM